jgi:hypothetical protein
MFQSLQGSFNTDESMHLIPETNGLHEPRLSQKAQHAAGKECC